MIGMKSEVLLLFRKFITSKTPPLTIRNLYAGKALNDNIDQKREVSSSDDVKKSKKKSTKDLGDIYKYFEGKTDLAKQADVLPSRIIMQRKSKPEHLYLFDNSVAENITDLIKDDLIADPQKVIEVNAGPGILTEKLLTTGVPLIRIMEQNLKFIQFLANLQTNYSDKIMIREADLFNIWRIAHQDKKDEGSRVADLFPGFAHAEWGEEMGLRIIGAVTSLHFINHLILDVVRQCGLVSYGRPCLYLAMPPSVWTRLTSNRSAGIAEYKSISVLFQLFFDYKLLCKVPRKAYLPWVPSYTEKAILTRSKKTQQDKDHMCIVKIEGKKNLFADIIDTKHIQPLWYFVNHHMIARTNRVIPHMEGWEPGCGPSLIMKDFNIFTQFGDLSPQQLLELFKLFTSWEGYQNSFIPSMENSPQRMEQLLF